MSWLYGLLLICVSHSMVFKLSPEKRCFQFAGDGSSTLMYVVSGADNENTKVTILQDRQVIFIKENVKDFQDTRQYKKGNVQLCFESTDHLEKEVAFDFFRTDNPVRSVIDKKDLNTVFHTLKETKQQMQKVTKNQQFHIQRDQIHKEMLQQSEKSIKWTGAIKIIFLLSSALVQLWIMKNFFKNSSKSYTPVQMT